MHDQSAAEAAVMQPALLLVDDDENILSGLGMLLRREGFMVRPFRSWDDQACSAAALCQLVLLDVYLGAQNGHQVLRELIAADPLRPVILISGQAGPEEAVRAIGSGAFDFIEKPFSAERLLLTVNNALRYRELNRTLVSRLVPVRASPAMVSLCRDAARFARSGATVLIDGESGTGKDVLANLLHALSARSAGPLVKINCGAIPAELAESELFGHARGAFTGAEREYGGRILAAQGGTLFLDEVAELPLPVQAKLLRFLENGELQRIGDQTPRLVQTRVLAASNTSLDDAAKSGRFREDLFFRLAVLRLHVPPLRERRPDILPLVDWFLDTAAMRDGRPLPVLSDTARAVLEAYSYPGNVRELRNIVERLLCHEGGLINAAVV
ncbi:MAG: sigma-54 dependent transcriptional regulator, partial [Spirochaetes bacterium]|nr:sigma-54 dependent transcriptional regulator [Spirochaetota bacterium]MBU0953825.1 sigma-54 dependent transcriptional regulator [Spirochaetota bacterium]